jgi:hypothetical protein
MNKRVIAIALAVACSTARPEAVPWQTPCASAQRRGVERLLGQDRVVEADSAFSSLEAQCSLTAGDLLKWMRVKGVLFQFAEAGRLACLVVRAEPDAAFLAQDQLSEMIRDAAVDTVRAVLRDFRECLVSSRKQDTASVARWMAAVYDRFDLFDEEADVLLRFDGGDESSVNDLDGCARRFFSRGMYPGAIRLAAAAYPRLRDEVRRSSLALLLHESYARSGKNDSAAFWLEHVSLSRPEAGALAAVFFQRAGLASKAESRIAALAPSFTRDTLAVRQRLFASDFAGAAALASKLLGAGLAPDRRSALQLWEVRAMLFCGKTDRARALIDSMEFFPAMRGAGEVVASALAAYGLQDQPGAWGLFGAVAYASWLDRPDKVLAALEGPGLDSCDARARRTIVLEGVPTLIGGGRFADVRRIMERTGIAPEDNEFRYYYGEVLYNEGAVDSARKVFEAMLLDRPDDVFCGRARIFLSRMNAGGRHGHSVDEKRHHR